MSYVIVYKKNNQDCYFFRKKDGKTQVYTFDSPDEAGKCIQLFQNYAIQEVMMSGDIFGFGRVIHTCANFEIKELPNIDVEKISFKELMKEKGYAI